MHLLGRSSSGHLERFCQGASASACATSVGKRRGAFPMAGAITSRARTVGKRKGGSIVGGLGRVRSGPLLCSPGRSPTGWGSVGGVVALATNAADHWSCAGRVAAHRLRGRGEASAPSSEWGRSPPPSVGRAFEEQMGVRLLPGLDMNRLRGGHTTDGIAHP